MVFVLGIHVPQRDDAGSTERRRPRMTRRPQESFWSELSGGFRGIAADRDLAVVIWLVSAQTIVAGASAVFLW